MISVLLLIAGTVCGQSRTYTQRKKPAKKHTYVDLGLSVKWATCNLGAQAPEDYGDYYAFGEVFTKKTYTEENCKTYHKIMNEISGNKTYDAATAQLGAGWRTPTMEEALELINKCEWTWAEQNGEPGYKVTGPNGNSIFLPAAGLAIGRERLYAGTNGYYRTSTPYAGGDIFSGFEETHKFAWILGYDDLLIDVHTLVSRDTGLSIRPVYGKRTISSNSTANMLSVTQEDLEQEACNARLRSCGNFYEGLASYKDANGKYGFIDETGKVVIPCQWNSVGLFCEGLASVMDDNRRCGFIDKTGKIVVPCRWRSVYDFKDGKAEVQDDNGKWHKIDKTGKIVE